jgi:hypothetical protein
MTNPYPYATKAQLQTFREWLGEQPADTFHMAEFQFDENDGIGPHVEHPCLTAACIEGFWDWHSRIVGLTYPPRLPNRDDVFYLREDEEFCYVAGELFTMSNFDRLPAPLRKTIMLAVVDNLIEHGKPMWQEELDKHLNKAP